MIKQETTTKRDSLLIFTGLVNKGKTTHRNLQFPFYQYYASWEYNGDITELILLLYLSTVLAEQLLSFL